MYNVQIYTQRYCIVTHIFADGYEQGDVSLSSTDDGRVEVYLSGYWVHVANTGSIWTLQNSEVVCRELGYAPNGKQDLD